MCADPCKAAYGGTGDNLTRLVRDVGRIMPLPGRVNEDVVVQDMSSRGVPTTWTAYGKLDTWRAVRAPY